MVKVTGKLEIRGTITGKVWFAVDKEVVITGSLGPADSSSKLRVYSQLSGSNQILTGLFWGRTLADHSGSAGQLRGAMISNGTLLKLAGSDLTVVYDANAIRF